jgi:hypothetical protein
LFALGLRSISGGVHETTPLSTILKRYCYVVTSLTFTTPLPLLLPVLLLRSTSGSVHEITPLSPPALMLRSYFAHIFKLPASPFLPLLQVILLRSTSGGVHESREHLHECRAMLETQLQLCDELLSLHHPLAAKMLAVKVKTLAGELWL